MSDQRFFIDHGTIHDRKTGRHVRTDGDFGPGKKYEEDGIEQCCALLNELQARHARTHESLTELIQRIRTMMTVVDAEMAAMNARHDMVACENCGRPCDGSLAYEHGFCCPDFPGCSQPKR